jgi:NAD(P)H-dependent flavin oxidoreductase YrpB (nitropropane dioxygenase family)
MLRTRFCERFGIEAPIVVAPMGPDLTGPELVAAVCNAGGFGILQAQMCPPPLLRQQIHRLRSLTAARERRFLFNDSSASLRTFTRPETSCRWRFWLVNPWVSFTTFGLPARSWQKWSPELSA